MPTKQGRSTSTLLPPEIYRLLQNHLLIIAHLCRSTGTLCLWFLLSSLNKSAKQPKALMELCKLNLIHVAGSLLYFPGLLRYASV